MKRTSEARISKLLELLGDGKPRTTPQAADELRCDASTLSGAMFVLFERKQVHIVDWVPRQCGNGKPIAVYVFGDGPNKEAPVPLSKAELRKRQSLKEIEERERLAAEKAREIVPFRHWQDQALFGEHRRAA